jgi:hypothetical protein
MDKFFLTLLTGLIFGTIDILPMLKMKLDKHSIISAFVFYLIVPFIIYNINLFGMAWWLKGGVITLLLASPVIIIVAKDGIKNAVPIIIMSIVLGTLISVVGKFLIKI